MRNITPGGSVSVHETRLETLGRFYPERIIRCAFDPTDVQTFDIISIDNGMGEILKRFMFEFGGKAYHVSITDDWHMDLTATTIDLDAKTGGVIDGLGFASGGTNSRIWLLWMFLDEAFNFAGFGMTRKPYSTFAGVGTASKGSTGVFTGMTNAAQFVVGSRVVVRNNIGTAPLFEWNWGTVASIASTTSITVLMDNNANYGTNITGITSAFIHQWDTFRPYVISGTTQTLYAPYYSLVGEIYTDSSTGDIDHVYRADDPERSLFNDQVGGVVNSPGAVGLAKFDCARYIPLWAEKAGFRLQATGPGINQAAWVIGPSGNVRWGELKIQTSNSFAAGTINHVNLFPYAKTKYSSTTTGNNTLTVGSYWVTGGMRG